MLKRLGSISEFFIKISLVVSQILLIIMTGVIVALVISRYFFLYSFSWAEELTKYLMVWMVLLGAAIILRRDEHIKVDYFFNLLPKKVAIVVQIIFRLLVIIYLVVLCKEGFTTAIMMSKMSPMLIVVITRGGKSLSPTGDQRLLPGDKIVAIMPKSSFKDFRTLINRKAAKLGKIVVSGPCHRSRCPWDVEFGVCDRRVLASVNGQNLLAYSYRPRDCCSDDVTARLAVAAMGVSARFSKARIYRDVHYAGPAGQHGWTLPRPLGPDECFVVGDNVPVSIDSRRFGPIENEAILGPVHLRVTAWEGR